MQKLKLLIGLFLLLSSSIIFAATPIPIYTDTQKNITVTTDQPTFIIKLKSNPTTGYDWAQPDYDSMLLKLVSYNYESSYDPTQKMRIFLNQPLIQQRFQKINKPGVNA